MFVTDIGSNAIVQFNLSTRSRNVVVNTTGYIPECIAIDMVGEKLFWIARHPGKRDKYGSSVFSCRQSWPTFTGK